MKALATSIRRGNDIVVPQPTCGYVLKKDYVDYVGGADAQLVAEHTYDAAEYLMKVHKADGTTLDTDFHGPRPGDGHLPHAVPPPGPEHRPEEPGPDQAHRRQGHARAAVQRHRRHVGAARRERRTSACRSPRSSASRSAAPTARSIAGDCHLANTAITEQTGEAPLHPLQLIARAYGISEEVSKR